MLLYKNFSYYSLKIKIRKTFRKKKFKLLLKQVNALFIGVVKSCQR